MRIQRWQTAVTSAAHQSTGALGCNDEHRLRVTSLSPRESRSCLVVGPAAEFTQRFVTRLLVSAGGLGAAALTPVLSAPPGDTLLRPGVGLQHEGLGASAHLHPGLRRPVK